MSINKSPAYNQYDLFPIILTITVLLLFALNGEASATEIPDYSVIHRDGPVEIRDYPPMLIAEVTVSGNRNEAGSLAFRKLGGFIFGNNQTRSKVDMTAPVVQTPVSTKIDESTKIDMTVPVNYTPAGADMWVVNFMMPSEYTLDTLPIPNDPDIRVKMTKPYKAVTLRFPGRASTRSVQYYDDMLRAYIKAEDLNVSNNPDFAFYDAPWVPGPARRNEIHYRLVD